MLRELRKKVDEFHMVSPGDCILAGVSGGADSVCLLHILSRLKDKYGIILKAAHINHNLRGDESLRDEIFVKELCDKLSIPCFFES